MKKILIHIPDTLLSDVRELCERYNYQQSEFIRSCIRERIYFLKIKSPQSMKKEVHEEIKRNEKTIQRAREDTDRIISRPNITQSFALCKKHGGFYTTCGCKPE